MAPATLIIGTFLVIAGFLASASGSILGLAAMGVGLAGGLALGGYWLSSGTLSNPVPRWVSVLGIPLVVVLGIFVLPRIDTAIPGLVPAALAGLATMVAGYLVTLAPRAYRLKRAKGS